MILDRFKLTDQVAIVTGAGSYLYTLTIRKRVGHVFKHGFYRQFHILIHQLRLTFTK